MCQQVNAFVVVHRNYIFSRSSSVRIIRTRRTPASNCWFYIQFNDVARSHSTIKHCSLHNSIFVCDCCCWFTHVCARAEKCKLFIVKTHMVDGCCSHTHLIIFRWMPMHYMVVGGMSVCFATLDRSQRGREFIQAMIQKSCLVRCEQRSVWSNHTLKLYEV